MINDEKKLKFDIDDIKAKTGEFERKFTALTMLSSGNKVGIDSDDNLYAEYFTQPYLMAIIRKLTRQKREDINTYLEKNLDEYEQFLLFVINAYENKGKDNKQVFSVIITTHKMLCVGLVSGLTNLKASYPDYQPIIDTCTKYIEKFNLFRAKSNNLTLPF